MGLLPQNTSLFVYIFHLKRDLAVLDLEEYLILALLEFMEIFAIHHALFDSHLNSFFLLLSPLYFAFLLHFFESFHLAVDLVGRLNLLQLMHTDTKWVERASLFYISSKLYKLRTSDWLETSELLQVHPLSELALSVRHSLER